ncbi:hypothetical protein HF882_17880, partial [Victivallis vadensis]|nr:hypothetical protein [Victivallis vadensis]
QFRRNPLLYAVCCLPLLREITLERDARRICCEAERIVESTTGWHTGREFEKKRKQ